MKVLIIEDDGTQRLFLKRFLQKKLGYTVFEAINGLEGLSIMQEEKPDLILLDVMMPVMDGREFLEVVRQDHNYDSIPVVVLSAANEKSLVARLIKLGVTDYLVKPISTTVARRRLENIVKKYKSDEQPAECHTIAKRPGKMEKLLLIHRDTKFREWFKSLFSNRFDIIEENNGIDGMRIYLNNRPAIVCIGEGLKLLNEQMLARKLCALNEENKTGIYLITERENDLSESEKECFDGFIKLSYNNGEFLKSFSRTVLKENNTIVTVFDIAANQIRETLIKLTIQSLRIFSDEKISVFRERQYQFSSNDVYLVVELFEQVSKSVIAVAIIGSKKDVWAIVEKFFNHSRTYDQNIKEAFSDVLLIIGEGIKNILERYGIVFDESPIRIRINPYDEETVNWNMVVPFRFNEYELFGMGIAIKCNSDQ